MINFGSMLRFLLYPRGIFILFMAFGFLSAFQCHKYTHSQCINSKIASFQDECCEEGANVQEYTFSQETVFVFNPGFCGGDAPSYVITSQCDTLGFLGGLIGNTQINGQDFYANATFVGEVWSN